MKAYGGRHCIFVLADSDGVVDIAVSLAAGRWRRRRSGWVWASTIAGRTTVDRALAEGQMLAEDVAKKGRK